MRVCWITHLTRLGNRDSQPRCLAGAYENYDNLLADVAKELRRQGANLADAGSDRDAIAGFFGIDHAHLNEADKHFSAGAKPGKYFGCGHPSHMLLIFRYAVNRLVDDKV